MLIELPLLNKQVYNAEKSEHNDEALMKLIREETTLYLAERKTLERTTEKQ